MISDSWKNYTEDIELDIGDRVMIMDDDSTLYLGTIFNIENDILICILHAGEQNKYSLGQIKEKRLILMYESDNTFYRKMLLEFLVGGIDQDFKRLFPDYQIIIDGKIKKEREKK